MTTDGVIDRIEGAVAVIEIRGTFIDLPVSCLPVGASEGDSITLQITSTPKPPLPDRGPINPEIIDL